MVTADVFVSELDLKNQDSFRGLITAHYLPALASDGVAVADVLRWESKMIIESVESAALWLVDADSLELKLSLASYCGDRARHFCLLSDRLSTLGLAPGSYDPRQGGYSKLFACLRSMQTSEERLAAGFVTMSGMSVARLEALATWAATKSDGDTANLVRDQILPDETRRTEIGRDMLIAAATGDDSQSRARRAAYRAMEVMAELHDPATLRKLLGRSPSRK
jgi:hypothetical protein